MLSEYGSAKSYIQIKCTVQDYYDWMPMLKFMLCTTPHNTCMYISVVDFIPTVVSVILLLLDVHLKYFLPSRL